MPAPASVSGLSYKYPNSAQPLFSSLSLTLPAGFTAVVGPNGAGKSTLLRLICGQIEADEGHLQLPELTLYCAQRTDEPPPDLEDFLFDDDGHSFALQGRLGIDPSYLYRWESLSHGERKRCQIAWALWKRPDLLAIDEPSNHIDREARNLLAQALSRYRGIGLLVSHDRALLDELCTQCLWVSPAGVQLYAGNYSTASAQRRLDRQRAERERQQARGENRRLQRELARRREAASRSHRERSKRGLPPGDHDARARINLARVTNKDGQAGRLLKQLHGRAAQADARAASLSVEKQHTSGIWLTGTRAPRDPLLYLPAGEVPLDTGRSLRHPGLTMTRRDRVGITGVNGSGKSTLLRHVLEQRQLPAERLLYLPQEMTAADAQRVLRRVKTMNRQALGQLMNIVSRLGSRPERLLESALPSPGELRKLMLAEGMTRQPWLLVLDEPTNHLDLPSIETLESALLECPCALLLVSHDEAFLSRLAEKCWHLEECAPGAVTLTETGASEAR